MTNIKKIWLNLIDSLTGANRELNVFPKIE
jgi:hypothetical protein